MDVLKLLEIAGKLNVPGLVAEGIAFVAKVRENAERAKDVLVSGERAELDMIHAEALAVSDRLDAALAAAEKR